MKKNSTKVSVLIPTYNYAHFLVEAIESVLAQTYTDFELIIVDNNSTDNTTEIVSRFLGDERVKYYRNETNLGLLGNWNKCLEYATGEYIKYLCADDKFQPLLLEKFVRVLDENSNVSLVTAYRTLFGNGKEVECKPYPFQFLQNGQMINRHTLYNNGWLGEPTSVMFRKADLKVGIFGSKYKWLIDMEMWFRLLTVGDCYIVPEYLILIRKHDAQQAKWMIKTYLNIFEEYEFAKELRDTNNYKVDISYLKIDTLVAWKAKKVASLIYKNLIHLNTKEGRYICIKAINIAWKEKVIASPILERFKKLVFRRTNSLLLRN